MKEMVDAAGTLGPGGVSVLFCWGEGGAERMRGIRSWFTKSG